jgi:two-component system response regulator AtoC
MSGAPPRDEEASTLVAGSPGPTRLRLKAFWPGGGWAAFDLPVPGTVTLGRSRDADVRLEHPSVSRRHAAIHVGPDQSIEIEDLRSANATLVDGKAVPSGGRVPVAPGTVVEMGQVRLLARREPIDAESTRAPLSMVEPLLERVAGGDINVLVVGETGVGKEVVAEKIHGLSPRAKKPFLCLNCAALPEHLLESELFGFERGAFTGAQQAKPGLLEEADGGTVLLDEVAEMPMATQAKLLRVIERREITRLGSLKPKSIDVRFVAATHRDLDDAVSAGKFREDLLFRLHGITIHVPPLRERSAEVPILARGFLAEACAKAKRTVPALTDAALALLSAYRWPGNVRELRNVIDRALLLSSGDSIDAEHIDFARAGAPGARGTEGTPSQAPPAGPAPSGAADAGDDGERARILGVLAECAGNQTRAARKLGITRRMLVYRLDALGVPRPRKGR